MQYLILLVLPVLGTISCSSVGQSNKLLLNSGVLMLTH